MESKEPKAQSTIHGLFSNAYIKFSLVNCGKKKTLKKCGVFKKTVTMDRRRHSDMTGDQKTCFVGNYRVIVWNSPEDQKGKDLGVFTLWYKNRGKWAVVTGD